MFRLPHQSTIQSCPMHPLQNLLNLILLCEPCHKKCEKNRGDQKYEKKIKRLKKNIFRHFIGPTSYDVLLHTIEKRSVLTFPYADRTLLQLNLVELMQENPMSVGMGAKPSFSVYSITDQGKTWARELDLRWSP